MPAKGTKYGDRSATPQPFAIFWAKNRRYVGVRIGSKRAYTSASEVTISQLGLPVHVVATADGLVISGEGVVRQEGESVRITA